MKRFYSFTQDCKRSTIEITSNIPFEILKEYRSPRSTKRLPNDAVFWIVKGTKFHDIISLHEARSFKFYSERLINILSRYADISEICYPVNIKNCDTQYYAIYNLKSYVYFNYEYCKDTGGKEEDAFYIPMEGTDAIFNLLRIPTSEELRENSIDLYTEVGIPVKGTLLIVVHKEIKEDMQKEGVTNVRFQEWQGYNIVEYTSWKKKHVTAVHIL